MASLLSSYVLTHNSERHLARVLSQLKRVADEVIVADSGSTDGTLEIARRFRMPDRNSAVHEFL